MLVVLRTTTRTENRKEKAVYQLTDNPIVDYPCIQVIMD